MNFFTYFVEKGDTLFSICQRHRQLVKDFLEFNEIYPPRELLPGEEVKIPCRHPYKYFHLVQPGETTEAIAARYHTSPQSIKLCNMIDDAPVGQYLYIPEVRVKLWQPQITEDAGAESFLYKKITYLIDDIRKVALREQLKILSQWLRQPVKLRQFWTEGSTAYLDISNLVVQQGVGAAQELTIINVLLDALLPFSELAHCQFLINGIISECANGHICLGEPFVLQSKQAIKGGI
ncbi:LysM peptidoglycan-binding domain-containing protein [Desulforamulus hydrothermalis]|nr:LysM domain-containing protein [Desulforamulus hydrothermalis]SHH02373.1 LysM domain-containing protein [Desulforamulus hydrothermalis Lam5 = DSM 18033]